MEKMNDVIKAAIEQAAPNLVIIRIDMQPIILLEEKEQQAWQINRIVEDQNQPTQGSVVNRNDFVVEGLRRGAVDEIPSLLTTRESDAWQSMTQYTLKPWQKDLIVSESALLETLIRVHSEFENGLRPTVKNRTAYLVKSLGIANSKPLRKGKFSSSI